MDAIQSLILGIVQGLTEFLPISSTAHLRIIPSLLGWSDPGAAFSAVIQLGTLLAVLVYFFRDLVRLCLAALRSLMAGRPFADQDSRLAWMVVLGTLPIGVAGLIFKEAIETSLRSLWVIAAALAGLGLCLLAAERFGRRTKTLASIGWWDGLAIGLAQALALIPGASRSGVTITAALLFGLTRPDAARFSFLLSVPAVLASGLFEILELRSQMSGMPWLPVSIGAGAAAISGFLAIAILLRFLERHSTVAFVAYRLCLAALIAALLSAGILS